jgi:hypothetical protein
MSSIVLDAFTGQPLGKGAADIISIFGRAQAFASRPDVRAAARRDGITNPHTIQRLAMAHFRADSDARFIQGLVEGRDSRNDALLSDTGSFPRDFEFIYEPELEETRAPLNLQRLFQMDTRVPLGAKTHTVRRRLGTGDAAVVRTGTEIPVVGHQRVEEQFNVLYLAAAVETDWFDMISDSFEGRNNFQDDTRMAVRAIDERLNDIGFFGHAPSNMPGVLNYPVLAKSVSPESWKVGGSSPAAIVAALHAAANFANETSKGAMRSNRMGTSIQIRNFLMQTRMETGTDTTIGEFFLRGNEFINTIESAHEFEGIGPNGEDGIFFYNDALESTAVVMIQPPTPMPAHQVDSFRSHVVYVAAFGGAVQRDVGANHLLLVNRS